MVKCWLWRAGPRRLSMPKAEATGLAPKQAADAQDPLASSSEGFVLLHSPIPPCCVTLSIGHFYLAHLGHYHLAATRNFNSVLPANGDDPGVVCHRTGNPARDQDGPQRRPVVPHLPDQVQGGRLNPSVDLVKRGCQRRRGTVDLWMSDNGQKLMDAGPRNRPRRPALRQPSHTRHRRRMPWRIFPVGIDENIRVGSDQPPRPS